MALEMAGSRNFCSNLRTTQSIYSRQDSVQPVIKIDKEYMSRLCQIHVTLVAKELRASTLSNSRHSRLKINSRHGPRIFARNPGTYLTVRLAYGKSLLLANKFFVVFYIFPSTTQPSCERVSVAAHVHKPAAM